MKTKLFRLTALIIALATLAAPVSAQPLSGPTGEAIAADNPGALEARPGIAASAATSLPTGEVIGEVAGASGPATYIIMLTDPPLASYRGGIAGLEATNPAARGQHRLDLNSPASQAYLAYLDGVHNQFVSTVEATLGHAVEVKFDYRHAFNGMAMTLTPEEAAIVAGLPGVRQVQREFLRYPTTDAGPQWIGAPDIWNGTSTGGLPGTQGEGVTVGVIDTGQNLDHPSFAEVGPIDGYVHVNPLGSGNFLGLCASDPGTWVCNDKLIGYYIFTGETTEDTDGHGSHTASTAAGNVVTATLYITATNNYTYVAQISGVAPHANIIGYDACNDTGGCPGSALVAAINQTVADGVVNVINYSIGGGSTDPWSDADALAFLGAADAGIVPVTSAGNAGPGASTVGSPADAPWMLSVGASTHNRAFLNGISNMSGGATPPPADITGLSPGVPYGPAPIVYAGDYGDAMCLNPFPANTWTNGEIVVCDRGVIARVGKGVNVLAGGAGGMVLANTDPGQSLNADPHILPAVHINATDGDTLRTWLASGSGHVATIDGSTVDLSAANGDIMAGFSSRGPLLNTAEDIIKPDVTAPGVSILAAYRTGSGPPGDVEPWMEEFNLVSGTSMSSPHTAGAAALMVALHPEWSPAEVKSALMSTAQTTGVVKEDGSTPADPFDMGGGRVDLTSAGQTGLVLDETTANFQNANPGTGGDPKTLNLASLGDNNCQGSCSWTRVVSSTLSTTETWTVTTSATSGLTITVQPSVFTLPAYATQTITITADTTGASPGVWEFGQVVMTPASAPSVSATHFPVATLSPQPIIDVTPGSLASTQAPDSVITTTLTIANNGGGSLDWTIFEDAGTLVGQPMVDWFEDFDSYAAGSQMHGQGGWKGWGNNPAAGALVSDAFAHSSPNSVDIVGASDLVHEYAGYTSGTWAYTAWQYIPDTFSGESYFILLNQYDDLGTTNNWSTQVHFNSATGTVIADGVGAGSTLPLVTGRWVELRVIIDLDNDLQLFLYDGQLLYQGSWTDGVSGGGIANIGAVDLFANGASSVFYDDMSLVSMPPLCSSASDIPWLSAVPTTGSVPASSSQDVDVVFDSTGLALGTYNGFLCVTSNDVSNPLVPVPVTLNVAPTVAPVIEVDPASLTPTVPQTSTLTSTLTISNTGNADLDWNIFEDNSTLRTPLFPAYTPPAASNIPVVIGDLALSTNPNPVTAISQPAGEPEGILGGGGTITITHSASQTIMPGNSVSCNAGGLHADNSYIRRFTLSDFGILGAFEVNMVQVGIEVASAGSGGSQPATVNLYTWDPATSFTFGNFSLIGTANLMVADQSLTIIDIPINTTVPSGATLVVEFFTPDGQAAGHSLFVGSNNLGQTDATFLAAAACGVTEPTDTAAIGFPGMHLVMNVIGVETSTTCDAPDDIPWVSVSPISGTTPISGTSAVDVLFDSTGLATGTYTGTLCVSSNDPLNPLVTVPLTMTVIGRQYGVDLSAAMALSGTVGSTVTYTVDITNTGNVADVFDLTNAGETWSTTLSTNAITLNVGESGSFTVMVDIPASASDGANDTVTVTATSQGDPAASDSVDLTTTAIRVGNFVYLPTIIRP